LQFTSEVRGTDFQIDGVDILRGGKSRILEDRSVLDVASRYMHIPCVRNLFAGAPYLAVT
jgi:hypothetical protein